MTAPSSTPTTTPDDEGRRRRARPAVVRRLVASPRVREAVALGVVLLALEVLTFSGWLTGSTAPPWDFYNQYNTEAWAWWRDGGALAPPQWMPYAWGGYPALLDAQNSSWYLPVGLVALVTPFTIHASAVLAALHVAAGAVGLYVLVRSWGATAVPALLGAVAWFYAAGWYSNASHLDISRAYTWVPWLLLVAGPTWRWDRWWRWPLGVLLLWQGLLALYPGIVVALVYVGAVTVAAVQIVHRPRFRSYLLPLAVAASCAGALAALRYLPFFLVRGAGSPSSDDASAFPLTMLGTFLYPYGAPELPNDVTMRSFFVAAPVLALLALVPWASRRIRPVLVLVAAAAALGLPVWPWHDAVRSLPGMSLSRFTMSDFKPLLLLGIVLLAVAALDGLTRRGLAAPRRLAVPAALTAALVVVLAVLGVTGPWDTVGWTTQFLLLAVSVVAVWSIVLGRGAAAGTATVLVAVTAASGLVGALSTSAPWQAERLATEELSFGAPVDALVAGYQDPDAAGLLQRPARDAPDGVAEPAQALSTIWGRAFYTGGASVMGYVNLKGSAPFESINDELFEGDDREGALRWWAAPGVLVAASEGYPSESDLDACVTDGTCGRGLRAEPAGYVTGRLTWAVDASSPVTVSANEAWYPGWTARACGNDGGDCTELEVGPGVHDEVTVEVPAGERVVTLEYRQPGQRAAAGLAVGALLLTSFAAVVVELRRRRGRS